MNGYDFDMDIMEMDDAMAILATTDFYGPGDGKFDIDLYDSEWEDM